MNSPQQQQPPPRPPLAEVRSLINQLKFALSQSVLEGKKIEWEIDEFVRTIGDLKNALTLLKATGPYLNQNYPTDANNPNRELHRYWNSMRDGYGGR